MQCTNCQFTAKNKSGLMAHQRARHAAAAPSIAPATPAAPAALSAHGGDCAHCQMLPAGSVKITSLFLVLVFALSAITFMAFYQIKAQQQVIQHLQAQLSHYES